MNLWTRRFVAVSLLAFSFLCAFVGITTPLHAGNFETRQDQLFGLMKSNRWSELATVLSSIPPGGPLEDLREYLLGQALKEQGREIEAIQVWESLLKKFPESLGARKAGLPYALLAAKQKGPPAYSLLHQFALALPSAYQRGRALEGLIDLGSPRTPERGKTAWEALLAYREGLMFFQDCHDSADLLKRILQAPAEWLFSRDEWLQICVWANREGLGKEVLRIVPSLRPALGKAGETLGIVLQADALRNTGQKDRAGYLLSAVLGNQSTDPLALALAAQLRGDLLAAAGRHESAVMDIQVAIHYGKAPVDLIGCRYRLMKSAFLADQDQVSFEAAVKLCQEAPKLTALPGQLYELALKRFDDGYGKTAVPFFLLLTKHFPGHYRSDDGLGYAAIALGPTSAEGSSLLKQLKTQYPHSFFFYWLVPEAKTAPLPMGPDDGAPVPAWAAPRFAAWRVLLRGPFAEWAREEIRQLLDEHPQDFSFFKGLIQLAQQSGDFHQATAYAERLLKNTLDAGKSAASLPRWAWEGYYPRPFWVKIQVEARRQKVDPSWVLAIMREESHFNPKTLSRSNAMGLMQILPSTGSWIAGKLGLKGRFNPNSLWDPDRNITFGTWYLRYLFDLFGGDLFLATASYNGGQGNIQRKVEAGPYKNLPVLTRLDRVPLPETRDYYKKVMGSCWNYRRLYRASLNGQ